MADMKPYLYTAVLLCLVMGSQSETTEVFKGIFRPLLETCKVDNPVTQEEYDSVLNMDYNFSPAAKCLLACALGDLSFLEDGVISPPEEYLVSYKELYADRPERLENAIDVITSCYDEVTQQGVTDTCENAALMVGCTKRLTYGEK